MKAGASEVAIHWEPRVGAESYARTLKHGEQYPLVGADKEWIWNPRRTPGEHRVYATLTPGWWQIDVPEHPVAWVRRAETEVVEEIVEVIEKENDKKERVVNRRVVAGSDDYWPAGSWPTGDWADWPAYANLQGDWSGTTWPHLVRTWPAVHDVGARYLSLQEGLAADAYRVLSAADEGELVATLSAGAWYPILDPQAEAPAGADLGGGAGRPLWYRIRYGAAAGDEGWVRGDAVETRAYLPAGATLYEPVPPAGPYLQAKRGLTASVDVRPKPTRNRLALGYIAPDSRQRYRIEGRLGRRPDARWWQIDFHGAIGWVHTDLVDTHGTARVPRTWFVKLSRAPGETELVLRAGPGTAYAVQRRVRGDAARLHYVKNKDAAAPAWWRVSTYDWVQNDHVQVQGDARRVVRAAAPALGESGPPYAQQAADAPVRVHQAPGRQRAVVTSLDLSWDCSGAAIRAS